MAWTRSTWHLSRPAPMGTVSDTHTTRCFHLPRRKTKIDTNASSVSDTMTDQKTPAGPNSRLCASNHASGICTIQKQPRLMRVGVIVSPAPLKLQHHRDGQQNDRAATVPFRVVKLIARKRCEDDGPGTPQTGLQLWSWLGRRGHETWRRESDHPLFVQPLLKSNRINVPSLNVRELANHCSQGFDARLGHWMKRTPAIVK